MVLGVLGQKKTSLPSSSERDSFSTILIFIKSVGKWTSQDARRKDTLCILPPEGNLSASMCPKKSVNAQCTEWQPKLYFSWFLYSKQDSLKKLTGLRYLLDRPAIHIGWTPGQGCGKLLAVAMPKSPCDFFCNFCMSWSSLRPSQEISSPRNKVPCNSGVKAP